MRPNDIAERIRRDAAGAGFSLDLSQERALEALTSSDRGVWIHGPVGRGKTWLADAWFRHAPDADKRRVHVHGFLDELHRAVFARQIQLRERRLAQPVAPPQEPAGSPVVITTGRPEAAGSVDVLSLSDRVPKDVPSAAAEAPFSGHDAPGDPVARALDDVVGSATLLVFDEFHLHDTGDARILTRLLEHAFDRGIRIVATSNYAPDELLPDPVWHHIMEPGILLIEQHMTRVRLDGDRDHRRSATAREGFAAGSWQTSAPGEIPSGSRELAVRDRSFEVAAATDDALWITFAQLCDQPTSTIEYLDWARRFPAWVVLDVPAFDETPLAAQQRFLAAVDVLVDEQVPTTFVSPASLDEFAAAAGARPDAPRLLSRLSLLR